MNRKRMMASMTLGAMALSSGMFLVSPAFAEGTINTSMSGAGKGFSSRSWQDSQVDSNDTTVTFSGCSTSSGVATNVTLNMYDEHGIFPDASIGTRANTCGVSNWGHGLNSDQFHYTIDGIAGAYSVNVSAVTIRY